MDSNKFNEHCNTINDINIEVFGVPLDKEVFYDEDKLKKVFYKLSKQTHPDTGQEAYKDGILSQRLNDAYYSLRDFLKINPNCNYSLKYHDEEKKDGKKLLDELRNKADYYNAIKEEYREELEDFERLLLFSSKNDISLHEKEYKRIINKLDRLLYISNLEKKLKEYVYENGKVNGELFIKFNNESRKYKDIETIKELYKQYYQVMQKNAIVYINRKKLENMYKGYNKNYFSKIMDCYDLEINQEKDLNNINEISIKYEKQIEIKKQIVDYYSELKQIMIKNKNIDFKEINIIGVLESDDLENAKNLYKDLKQRIELRIEYSKKVKEKLQEFLFYYENNTIYSYTYPYIKNKVYSYLNYYNPNDQELILLETILDSLKIDFENKKNKDIDKANSKKAKLKRQFKTDFDNHIFVGNGLKDINNKIDRINTFGGFSDFSNKVIASEMSNVLTDVQIHLGKFRILLEKTDGFELNLEELYKAINLWKQAREIIEGQTDYKKIRNNQIIMESNKKVSYRKFSLMLQTLKGIDYYHADLSQIESVLNNFDEFLNGEKKDKQLMDMVNNNGKNHDKKARR